MTDSDSDAPSDIAYDDDEYVPISELRKGKRKRVTQPRSRANGVPKSESDVTDPKTPSEEKKNVAEKGENLGEMNESKENIKEKIDLPENDNENNQEIDNEIGNKDLKKEEDEEIDEKETPAKKRKVAAKGKGKKPAGNLYNLI